MPDHNSPFHVPVLLAPILTAAQGAHRAVDATLGDGGPRRRLDQGIECRYRPGPRCIAVSRADSVGGIRYLQASMPRGVPGAVAGFGPESFCSTSVFPPGLDEEAAITSVLCPFRHAHGSDRQLRGDI